MNILWKTKIKHLFVDYEKKYFANKGCLNVMLSFEVGLKPSNYLDPAIISILK